MLLSDLPEAVLAEVVARVPGDKGPAMAACRALRAAGAGAVRRARWEALGGADAAGGRGELPQLARLWRADRAEVRGPARLDERPWVGAAVVPALAAALGGRLRALALVRVELDGPVPAGSLPALRELAVVDVALARAARHRPLPSVACAVEAAPALRRLRLEGLDFERLDLVPFAGLKEVRLRTGCLFDAAAWRPHFPSGLERAALATCRQRVCLGGLWRCLGTLARLELRVWWSPWDRHPPFLPVPLAGPLAGAAALRGLRLDVGLGRRVDGLPAALPALEELAVRGSHELACALRAAAGGGFPRLRSLRALRAGLSRSMLLHGVAAGTFGAPPTTQIGSTLAPLPLRLDALERITLEAAAPQGRALSLLAAACPRLRHARVSAAARHVTESLRHARRGGEGEGGAGWAAFLPARALETLDLRGLDGLDQDLPPQEALAGAWPRLRALRLVRCGGVRAADLAAAAPALERVTLHACSGAAPWRRSPHRGLRGHQAPGEAAAIRAALPAGVSALEAVACWGVA